MEISNSVSNDGLMELEAFNSLIGEKIPSHPKEWYKAITEYFDEIKEFKDCWEQIWSSDRFRFGQKASDLAVKHTLPLIKKINAQEVWDIGAGTGRDSIMFSGFCGKVTCVEISKAAANSIRKQAAKKNIMNMKVINGDVWSVIKKQNSIKGGFVNIIHAHSFLHYTKSIMTRIIFKEVHKLLAPGGFMVFAVKSRGDHLFGKGNRINDSVWVYEDGQRRKFYTEDDVRELLKGPNFKIEMLKTEKEQFDGKISEFVICIAGKQ